MRFKTNVRIFRGKMDLAPIVDVMFILVIFFLISTSYDFQTGYEVDLPKSDAPLVAGDKLVVVVAPRETQDDKSGVVVFFNNEEVDWENLEVKLAESIHDRSQPKIGGNDRMPIISLKVHGNIPHRHTNKILDLAFKLGVRVNLVTSPLSENL